MNQKIEEILKVYTDRAKYNTGYYMYKRNLVRNNYAKSENNNYIFYGSTIDEQKRAEYTSMININSETRTVSNLSCDCSASLTNTAKSVICSHVAAVVLKGMDEIQTKGSNVEKKGVKISPIIRFDITESRHGNMDAKLSLDGVDSVEYRKIFNSYKEKNKLYTLSNGNYLDLRDKDLEKALSIIDILGIYNDFDNMKIPNNKVLYLDKIIEEDNLKFINGIKYVKNTVDKLKKLEKIKCEVPKELNATLRDYQVQGLEFLNTLSNYEFGGILADEMGLGKTIQAISFLLSNKGKKSIIIAPTSLLYNWKEEIEKFAPSLKLGIAYKSERQQIIDNVDNLDVILTTYTTFKNDLSKYEDINFDYCIIDEAQNIKNPDSIITKAIKEVNAKVRFAITGTPIENNLLELWSIFDFVMPGYLYNKSKFQNIFINDDKNIDDLKKLINPFIIRRTKKEVLAELPEKIEQKYYVELNKSHRQAYNGFLKLIKQKISINGVDNMSVFSNLTKLRQLCLAPEIMVKNFEVKNSKLELLIELLKENSDKKILVFSQFTKVLGCISERLDSENISYSYLDGKTPSKERLNLVNEFNESEENKVFLISLKAGSTGLNLTSASMVIHFDPWFNPSVENQASDRAHRIGQKNVVNIVKLIAKDTVEERVIALQEIKKELIKNMLDDNLDSNEIFEKIYIDEIINLMMQ